MLLAVEADMTYKYQHSLKVVIQSVCKTMNEISL